VYQYWWRIGREKMFFPGAKIIYFQFYIHLWSIYWLSVVYCNCHQTLGGRPVFITRKQVFLSILTRECQNKHME
jgi:hypothetical protein